MNIYFSEKFALTRYFSKVYPGNIELFNAINEELNNHVMMYHGLYDFVFIVTNANKSTTDFIIESKNLHKFGKMPYDERLPAHTKFTISSNYDVEGNDEQV